jgi:hypothetical protein
VILGSHENYNSLIGKLTASIGKEEPMIVYDRVFHESTCDLYQRAGGAIGLGVNAQSEIPQDGIPGIRIIFDGGQVAETRNLMHRGKTPVTGRMMPPMPYTVVDIIGASR